MVGSFEVRDLELDVLGAVVLPCLPTVTSRITEPSGIAALPGDTLLVSKSVMSSFIFFKVLVKRTLSLLPSSMSTLLSLEPATTGSRTSGKRPSSEKLVH
jgi:hypothetical protein